MSYYENEFFISLEVLEVKAETAMASIFQAISDGPNLSFLQHFPGIFSDYGHMLASMQIL